MAYRPLAMLHPDLTPRLIAVIIFLLVIAIGYGFGIYEGITTNNPTAAVNSLVAVLLYALPAFGLMQLKRWARLFELGLSLLFVLIGLVIMFGYSLAMGLITLVPHGLIALYLVSKDCRRAFGMLKKED